VLGDLGHAEDHLLRQGDALGSADRVGESLDQAFRRVGRRPRTRSARTCHLDEGLALRSAAISDEQRSHEHEKQGSGVSAAVIMSPFRARLAARSGPGDRHDHSILHSAHRTIPQAPDATGLAAAVKALGAANVFRNLTGLALNQENAAAAFEASVKTAQSFASKAGALAQQRGAGHGLRGDR
jgi:hypothetical protein